MNTIDKLNLAIEEFVFQSKNSILRPATGAYSTPFRGSLFGWEKAQDVERELAKRGASALFLGSNPNCPGSLDHIVAGTANEGHWPEFERQRASGYFGEYASDESGRLRAWDPLHNPSSMGVGQKASWTFYADAIREGVGSLDDVAFANVFPWGSGTLDYLLQSLGSNSSQLLDRVVEFANQQLLIMIQSLRPALVLCPSSVSNHGMLKELVLHHKRVGSVSDLSPIDLEGRSFNMRLGTVKCDGLEQPVLVLKHPSALRWNRKVDRSKIARAVSQAIRQGLGTPNPHA